MDDQELTPNEFLRRVLFHGQRLEKDITKFDVGVNEDETLAVEENVSEGTSGAASDSPTSTNSHNCVICLGQPARALMMPCKHLCVCTGCYTKLKQNSIVANRMNNVQCSDAELKIKCPMCRNLVLVKNVITDVFV